MGFSLPFNISAGVTGRRKLDEELYRTHIKPQIEEVLRILKRIACQTVADSDGFLDSEPEVRVISCLCDGSDRRFAEIGIDMGCKLYAVLPYPINSSFHLNGIPEGQREASSEELKKLVSQAQGTLQLNPQLTSKENFTGKPDKYEDSAKYERHVAYNAASSLMLSHSDVLLAIWDNIPDERLGGTYRTMLSAFEAGIPIIVISADSDAPMRLIDRDELGHKRDRIIKTECLAKESDCDKYVDLYEDLMDRFGIPKADAISNKVSLNNDRVVNEELKEYIQDLQDCSVSGCPSAPWFLNCIKHMWDKFFKALSSQQASAPPKKTKTPSKPNNTLGKTINVRRILADASNHYSAIFRSYVLLVCILNGLAVVVSFCAGMLSELWPAYTDNLPPWLLIAFGVIGFFIIITIIFYYILYSNGKWQRKHAHYRLIAEYRRHLEGMINLGQVPKILEPQVYYHNSGEHWTDWMAWLVTRQLPFENLDFSNAEQVNEKKTKLIKGWIDSQISYHAKKSLHYEIAEKKIDSFTTALFTLASVCVAANIFLEIANLKIIEDYSVRILQNFNMAGPLAQIWSHTLAVVVVGICTSLLFSLAVYPLAKVALSSLKKNYSAEKVKKSALTLAKTTLLAGIVSVAIAFLSASERTALAICHFTLPWWCMLLAVALVLLPVAGFIYQFLRRSLIIVLPKDKLDEQRTIIDMDKEKYAQLCSDNQLADRQSHVSKIMSCVWMASALLIAWVAIGITFVNPEAWMQSLPDIFISELLEKSLNFGSVISWSAGTLPLLAVTTHALGQYNDFRRLQLRATAMQSRLVILKNDLILTKNDSTKLMDICSEVCKLMVEEDLEWRIQVNMPVVSLA